MAGILYRLYGRVLIPKAVLQELQHPNTPPAIANWLAHRPAWLEIQEVPVSGGQNLLTRLDPGESAAILLAQGYLPDVLLLMDEENGRLEAERRNIRTTGTLGVLDDAAARGLVDLPEALARLRATNFRATESLLRWFLDRDAQRRKP